MKITVVNPTKAIIVEASENEINSLEKQLTYTNTSVQFQISQWARNIRMKKYRPDFWRERYEELKSQQKECILKKDENGHYWIRPGTISYLKEKAEVTNLIAYPSPSPIQYKVPLPFPLYDYQDMSGNLLIKERHGNVELSVGLGKTFTILSTAVKLGLQAVIVVPSKQIFLEMSELFEHHLGKEVLGRYGDGHKDLGKLITVCISKSLTMLEEGTKEYLFFSKAQVLIADEAHLLPAATLERVCHGVLANTPYRIFMSGTNVRGDGKNIVLESIIGKTVMKKSTEEGIKEGYLCPLKFTIIKTFSPVTTAEKDPIKAKRKYFLNNIEVAKKAAQIANASAKILGESTLILVEELSQIRMIIKLLEVPYVYCHSASKKDAEAEGLEPVVTKQNIEKFNRNEAMVLIGTSCVDTGTNMFSHNTINWVGGSSEVTTRQGTIGRSVRKLETSKYKDLKPPKPIAKIYDFNIDNIQMMKNQLEKRIEWYRDTGSDVIIVQ